MNVLILMGSPRLRGNTAELCKPFMEELEANGVAVRYVTLADKDIGPCRGCYACQNVEGEYGCGQRDEMPVEDILWADTIVLATPIYAWYCAGPMKNVLDRHYGFNKFYATDPFEMGVQRLCKHSGPTYLGLYSVRDTDNLASFQTPEAITGAKTFARKVLGL